MRYEGIPCPTGAGSIQAGGPLLLHEASPLGPHSPAGNGRASHASRASATDQLASLIRSLVSQREL